jgi:S-DNA-T family DNA segregation ATPase FtsK/SpoIIIE
MADIYTSSEDELTISDIISKGLKVRAPKWTVMRLALAYSLKIPSPPDESLDRIPERDKGSEYHFEQVTGHNQGRSSTGQQQDYTDAICGLLSVYGNQDLFANADEFRRQLQRHIRRGLREFRRGWREGHDFYQYLFQELCAGSLQEPESVASDFAELLMHALLEIGVQGEVMSSQDGPRITRYLIRLQDTYHLDRVRRGLD